MKISRFWVSLYCILLLNLSAYTQNHSDRLLNIGFQSYKIMDTCYKEIDSIEFIANVNFNPKNPTILFLQGSGNHSLLYYQDSINFLIIPPFQLQSYPNSVQKIVIYACSVFDRCSEEIFNIRLKAEQQELTQEEAITNIREIYARYKNMKNWVEQNIQNTVLQQSAQNNINHALKTYSAFNNYSFEYQNISLYHLLNIEIPILVVYGTKDTKSLLNEYLPLYFIKNDKDNLTMLPVENCNHLFVQYPDDKYMGDEVFAKIIRWFEDSHRALTPVEMQEDIDFFYNKLRSIHPNPYYKLSPEQLEAKIDQLKQSCSTPLTIQDFCLKLSFLNSYFDMHTTFSYGDAFWNNLPEQKFIVPPFSFVSKEGQLYFSHLPFWDDNMKGKKIAMFNHIPADTICKQIQSLHSYEVPLDKNSWVMARFFDLFYVFLYGATDTLSIEYVTENNQLDTVTLLTDSVAEEKWKIFFMDNWRGSEPYSFRSFPQESIAILELNTFSIYNSNEYKVYRKYIRNCMDTVFIQKIRHLFIDISTNGGGSSEVAYEILNFLKTKKSTVYVCNSKQKISTDFKQLVRAYYPAGRRCLLFLFSKEYRDMMQGAEGSFYNTSDKFRKKRTGKQFKQNVYLIQSRDTYSAAVDLVTAFREFKAGKTIGEETGGLTSGYINSVPLSLPNSKIKWMCASMEFVQTGSKKDGHGFFPDVEYPFFDYEKHYTLDTLQDMLKQVQKNEDNGE